MIFSVSPAWLQQSWYNKVSFNIKPQCCLANGHLKVTVFRENGTGMRSMSCAVDSKETCCFEVPDAFRAYISLLQFAKYVRIKIENLTMELSVETPSFAIQYKISNILYVEDRYVAPSDEDIAIEIGTEDWFHICGTMPQKGQIIFDCRSQKRMVTIKHSKNKWGAAIMARSKSPGTASFQCRAEVVRFCFRTVEKLPAFSTLIFMKCGVLKWNAGFMQVYLAPYEE